MIQLLSYVKWYPGPWFYEGDVEKESQRTRKTQYCSTPAAGREARL